MKARRLNFIIGSIAIIVILSLIGGGIYYYTKKPTDVSDDGFMDSFREQLNKTMEDINKMKEEQQRKIDIREDKAGKEARERYERTGKKTVVVGAI